MSGRRHERGATALPATLAAVAVSAALAGAVAEVVRIEVLVARHRQVAAAALATTDACLAALVAGVEPGWDFAAVLEGPDGRPGTADDGTLAAPPGCRASVRPAAGPAVPPRLTITVEGRVPGGRRVFDALAGRERRPGVPALLWLEEVPAADAVAGSLLLDGSDVADAAATDAAGLAAPADAAALDAWLAAAGSHVSLGTRTAPPLAAAAPPLAALAARARAAPHAGAEALVPGAPGAPALALVQSDLHLTAALHGAGLLLVDGVLEVDGSLAFAGVLVASGGVRIGPAARLDVDGVLWVGDGLRVDGTLALRQDQAAVDAADRLLELPRRTVVLGLRDLG